MKLSVKHMMPPLVAVAALTFASPAFAWSHSICNPTSGEVLGGNGAAPLTTEALYYGYLHDHTGSFEMSPGQDCTKTLVAVPPVVPPISPPVVPPISPPVVPPISPPVVPPISPPVVPPISPPVVPPISPPVVPPISPPVVPPTSPPVVPPISPPVLQPISPPIVQPISPPVLPPISAPVVPPTVTAPTLPVVVSSVLPAAAAPAAIVEHDNRPWICHYESSVGFATPRRSNDVLKDLAKVGNTAIGADGQCLKPVENPVAAVAPALKIAAVQPAAPLAPLATAAAPVTQTLLSSPASALAPAPPTVEVAAATAQASPAPELVPTILREVIQFAVPAAGDGSAADVLVP